jgi:hypothetical protein
MPSLQVTGGAIITPQKERCSPWLKSRGRRKFGIKYGTASPTGGLPRHVAQAQSTADCRQHLVRRCKPKTTEQTDDIPCKRLIMSAWSRLR